MGESTETLGRGTMKTFSKETVELAEKLASDIIGEDFPFGSSELHTIAGIADLELFIESRHVSIAENSQKRVNEQKEKLKAHGIVDDATAITFIEKRRSQLEKWKAAHDAFRRRVDLELKELQDSFRLDSKKLQDKFLDWND
jgi:hypothetical protein